jgi:predicted nuclease of predicted toxin-antitoxin system
VKLLFDENLAPRLPEALGELYPGSVHLRDCGLRGASDNEVWQYARENGFVIVSKDADFSQRSSLYGGPPKVVWLRIGNCTTARADFVLRNSAARLAAFEAGEESCLILAHPRNRLGHGASKQGE